MNEYPEFSLACRKAMAKRALFHERRLNSDAATGPMVTSARFSLINATVKGEPCDWAEKQELSGPNGGPIETTEITPTEKAKRIAFMLEKHADAAE